MNSYPPFLFLLPQSEHIADPTPLLPLLTPSTLKTYGCRTSDLPPPCVIHDPPPTHPQNFGVPSFSSPTPRGLRPLHSMVVQIYENPPPFQLRSPSPPSDRCGRLWGRCRSKSFLPVAHGELRPPWTTELLTLWRHLNILLPQIRTCGHWGGRDPLPPVVRSL